MANEWGCPTRARSGNIFRAIFETHQIYQIFRPVANVWDLVFFPFFLDSHQRLDHSAEVPG